MQPPYKQTNTDQQDKQTLLFQYTLFAYPQTKFRKTPTKIAQANLIKETNNGELEIL